ncbi:MULTISPECIES: ogr/Delta-like zinc finger family protein [Aeromonas]|uniref:ogr/Delta-like zinc finger family protein n=1 Tax=Aeromonas TaxID=642 RepID=UPI0022E287B7|nr:ogr/Delta-like zinc finger family protein [Aeromonas sp. Y318-1]
MRVLCHHCGGVGVITKTDRMSENVSNLYCRCKSDDCGHTWVSVLAYKHTIRPSANKVSALILQLIDSLSPEDKKQIIIELSKAK